MNFVEERLVFTGTDEEICRVARDDGLKKCLKHERLTMAAQVVGLANQGETE